MAQGAWEALPQEEEGFRLEVKDLLSSFTKVAELPAGRERRRGMEALGRALVKIHHGALGLKHAGALAEVRLLEERFPGGLPTFPSGSEGPPAGWALPGGEGPREGSTHS